MPTYGFIGAQGYGKSLSICEIGLYMANKYNRCIASNFPFRLDALWDYLIFRKYWNLCRKLIEGKFFYFNPYGESKDSILGLISVKILRYFLMRLLNF
ncbi:hypothetical protein CYANOKiyG1_28480 [Okeania sp. KiyG1]|nr:hypothetical protein CYANOKiyG1_28480 [Okeania sp. KiyG1]